MSNQKLEAVEAAPLSQHPVGRSVGGLGGQRAVVLQHPVVGLVGDVEVPSAIHCHAGGDAQAAGVDSSKATVVVCKAFTVPEHPVGVLAGQRAVILQDPAVVAVRDVEVATTVDCDA